MLQQQVQRLYELAIAFDLPVKSCSTVLKDEINYIKNSLTYFEKILY